jgi:hypothetical protein
MTAFFPYHATDRDHGHDSCGVQEFLSLEGIS